MKMRVFNIKKVRIFQRVKFDSENAFKFSPIVKDGRSIGNIVITNFVE